MNRLNIERMADFFSFQTKHVRFLLVVVGTLALLGGIKLLSPGEDIRMGAFKDVEAGQDTQISLQAEPNSSLKVLLTQANGLTQNEKVDVNEVGQATLVLKGSELEVAGSYQLAVAYDTFHPHYDTVQSFEVKASEPDLSQSRISFSTAAISKSQTGMMSVQLLDAYSNPVSGHTLNVVPDSSALQVLSSQFVTDESGQMTFTLMGDGEGLVQLNIFDVTLGEPILAPTQVALTGGPALENSSVVLAESGPVDSFVISGLDNESLAGENLTVKVKAIDEDGFTVTDYTGTIRFSSSDDQASLPNDYTFLAQDQGEHSFSLGVKFVTPGEQTLAVTDLDNVRVNGETDTTVSTEGNAATEYDSNFETNDFVREGDFELTSPASGSYSTDTIEIEGEAEYGYTAFIFVDGEEAGDADVEFDNSFSYTLQDLEDGSYEIYAEIRDEDDTVIETSSTETVTIDTQAPKLVSISTSPSGTVDPAGEVTVVVLSEADLDEASVLFEGEVYTMSETSTSGKYQVSIVAPRTEGEYSLDVLLVDALGNEVQYRDQATLTVSALVEDVTEPVVTVEEGSVDKVTNVTATGGPELVALSWQKPDSALSIAFYRVYYGPSPESLFALSETTDSSTNWTITDLNANEYYYFTVTAVDVEGNESDAGESVLGIPEASESHTTATPPTYPVSSSLDEDVKQTPDSGPAMNGLIILSTLGALGYVALRRRARV